MKGLKFWISPSFRRLPVPGFLSINYCRVAIDMGCCISLPRVPRKYQCHGGLQIARARRSCPDSLTVQAIDITHGYSMKNHGVLKLKSSENTLFTIQLGMRERERKEKHHPRERKRRAGEEQVDWPRLPQEYFVRCLIPADTEMPCQD